MDNTILIASITVIASALAATILISFKLFFDKKKMASEDNEVSNEVQKVITQLITIEEENKVDVLSLMIKNVAELREYYVINKQQARNSFSAALFICILGFLIFVSGVILSYYSPTESVIQYTTISGAIVEIIAGLFFWLYSKATKQINLFHSSLLGTQKFLTAIQLVNEISKDNKDQIYSYIIKKIIDNKEDFEIEMEKKKTPHKNK